MRNKNYCNSVSYTHLDVYKRQAQKQPLDPARIEKQMRKTGNTEFTFDNLEILIEGNVFLPMQALNELRREGIEELTEQIQMQYRREEAGCGMKTATAGFDSDADGVDVYKRQPMSYYHYNLLRLLMDVAFGALK